MKPKVISLSEPGTSDHFKSNSLQRFDPILGLPSLPCLSSMGMPREQRVAVFTAVIKKTCEFYQVDVKDVYIYRYSGRPNEYDKRLSAAISSVVYSLRSLGVTCLEISKILDRSRPTISTNTYRLRLKALDKEYYTTLYECLQCVCEVVDSAVVKHQWALASLQPESIELEIAGLSLLRARSKAKKANMALDEYFKSVFVKSLALPKA